MILLDTDHLSLLQARDAPAAFTLQARLEAFSPDEVVTTVTTLEEQMRGWPALIHRVTDAQRQVAYYERRTNHPIASSSPPRQRIPTTRVGLRTRQTSWHRPCVCAPVCPQPPEHRRSVPVFSSVGERETPVQ
jgi:hypothetical protein